MAYSTLVERLTERVEQLELKHVQGSGTGEKREVFPYRGRNRGHGRGGESWNSQGSQRSFVGHGQADEGGKNMACNPSIIATSHNSPTGGYRIEAIVNGIDTSLLLDTGAAVSLIREDTWLRGKENKSGELQPWTQHNMVSVDGSPLHIHGYTIATVELGGAELQVGMVVVSPLTTEAILGLDFLSKHRANIDLRKEEVHLDSCPRVLKLTNKTTARVKEDTTDALSQLPCQQCGRTSYQQSTEAADSAPPENIEQLQQDDPHIGPILKAKIDGKKPAPHIIQAASLAGGQGGQLPPLSPPPPCSNNADTRNKQGALAIICHYRASDRSKRARFQVYSLDLAIYKILRVTSHACISHMRMRMTFSRHANYVCPPRYKQLGTALGSTKRLFQIWEQLFVKRNCLYRLYQHPNTKTEYWQLIIPLAKREEILRDMHEGTLGGHLGEEKTFCHLRERYHWPGYYSDVQHWCRTCASCAARKTSSPKNQASLQNIKVGEPYKEGTWCGFTLE